MKDLAGKIVANIAREEDQYRLAEYGAKLACQLDKTLVLYNEKNISAPYGTEFMTTGALVQRPLVDKVKYVTYAREKLEAISKKLSHTWERIEAHIEDGNQGKGLVKLLRSTPAYLLIHQQNAEFSFWSSVSGVYETHLAESLETPVLIIPKECPTDLPQKLLYTMDVGTDRMDNLRFVGDLANTLRAELNIISINDKTEGEAFSKSQFEQKSELIKSGITYDRLKFKQYFYKDAYKGLTEIIHVEKPDLLVFQHQEESWWKRLFRDLSNPKIILNQDVPVLAF